MRHGRAAGCKSVLQIGCFAVDLRQDRLFYYIIRGMQFAEWQRTLKKGYADIISPELALKQARLRAFLVEKTAIMSATCRTMQSVNKSAVFSDKGIQLAGF
jgi:hypothetical protein